MAERRHNDRVIIASYLEEPVATVQLGDARRLVGGDDAPFAVNHVIIGPNAPKHYHRISTEVCVCLGGRGAVVCDGDRIPLERGVTVTIKPGTVHQYVTEESLEILLMITPVPGDPVDRVFTDVDCIFGPNG